MMASKKQDQNDLPYRRRGRPAGKNRVPLSLEEKRARNALYERERRNETADAMTQLAEAVGCDPNISNADLLATVISQIQRRTMKHSDENIDDLLRINANLESQIAMLQDRLGLDDESFAQLDNEEYQSIAPHSSSESTTSNYCNRENRPSKKQTRKRKRRSSDYSSQQDKRAKTQSETSTDSGIGLQSQSISSNELCAEINIQYAIPAEQLPLTLDTIEEQDHPVSQAHADLQTELYNQIYNSESHSSTQSVPEWEGANWSETYMEKLTRSLIVIPSIVSPQEPPDLNLEQPIQPEPSNVHNMEPVSDQNILNTDNECEILPRIERSLDFLTDNEKGLISDWLDGEFLETSAVNDQAPMTSYDLLSGYF